MPAHTYVRSGTGVTAGWTSSHGYTLGSQVQPVAQPNGNGFWYQATTGGTSGASSPAFPTVVGQTVTDGSVVWTCEGKAWAAGTTILASELAQFDASLVGLVNGEDGGCWAPQAPIVIGGSGMGVQAAALPTVIGRGGYLRLTGTTAGIVLDAALWPNYSPTHAGRTRVVQYSCALGLGWPNFAWRCRWADGGMQALCGLIDQSDGTGPQPVTLKVPLRCHNGSTLSQAKVYFRIGFQHTSLPGVMPKFRIVRVDSSGNVVPMTSQGQGADPYGYVSAPKPATPAQWSGNQSVTITCDQNNAIDLSQYTYYCEIVEEQNPSSGYPWTLVAKQPVKAVLSLLNPQYTVIEAVNLTNPDGVTLSTGDRILALASPGGTLASELSQHAGLYHVYFPFNYSAGNYATRSSDLQSASDFSQGMIIPVQQGNGLAGAYLQATSTITAWDSFGMPEDCSGWTGGAAYKQETIHVFPSQPNGLYYSTGPTGGTVGSTIEPGWVTTIGASVTDSAGVIFTCTGKTSEQLTFQCVGQLDDEVPGTAGSQLFYHCNIYDSVAVTFTGIANGAFQ